MAFYDNLKLEKGMYNSGNKSFTQVLEELDCSKNYEFHLFHYVVNLITEERQP